MRRLARSTSLRALTSSVTSDAETTRPSIPPSASGTGRTETFQYSLTFPGHEASARSVAQTHAHLRLVRLLPGAHGEEERQDRRRILQILVAAAGEIGGGVAERAAEALVGFDEAQLGVEVGEVGAGVRLDRLEQPEVALLLLRDGAVPHRVVEGDRRLVGESAHQVVLLGLRLERLLRTAAIDREQTAHAAVVDHRDADELVLRAKVEQPP